ncbi:hypothetical protein BGX28_005885 [Mortierella sp. GBA30]|nr:hypothetical protein BGX28_005885 [Mortierella sp. GBA30]
MALADSSLTGHELQPNQAPDQHADVFLYERAAADNEEDAYIPSYVYPGAAFAKRGESGDYKQNESERPRARPGPARTRTPAHDDHGRHPEPTKGHPHPKHGDKDPHHRKPAPCTLTTTAHCKPKYPTPTHGQPHHKPKDPKHPKSKDPKHPKHPEHPKPKDPKHPKPKDPKPKPKDPKPKPKDPKPKPKDPKPKPKNPQPKNPKPTPTTTSEAPMGPPTMAPVPPAQVGGGGDGNGNGNSNPSGLSPTPGVTGTDGGPLAVPSIQPTSGLVAGPASTTQMSGSSSSSLAAVVGAVVGSIALIGLFALAVYRRREKRRGQEEDIGPDPEMDEAPRTAFRHESFMALVKDAAQGFYAPGTQASAAAGPAGSVRSPSPLGTSTAVASAGTGVVGGADLARQTSQHSQRSLHSRRSGNYSGSSLHGGAPPTTLPPLAHIGGSLSD